MVAKWLTRHSYVLLALNRDMLRKFVKDPFRSHHRTSSNAKKSVESGHNKAKISNVLPGADTQRSHE